MLYGFQFQLEANLEENSFRCPGGMGKRAVDNGEPQTDKQDIGIEVHTLRVGSTDQGWCDHSKVELEQREKCERDGCAEGRVRCGSNILVEEMCVGASNNAPSVLTENKREPIDDPKNRDDGEADVTLDEGGDDILALDHSTIEECEARGHEKHKTRRDYYPRNIGRNKGLWIIDHGLASIRNASNEGREDEEDDSNGKCY